MAGSVHRLFVRCSFEGAVPLLKLLKADAAFFCRLRFPELPAFFSAQGISFLPLPGEQLSLFVVLHLQLVGHFPLSAAEEVYAGSGSGGLRRIVAYAFQLSV